MKFKQRIIISCIETLNSIAKKIQKLSNRLLIDTDEKLDYSSLSPMANADPQGDYTKALRWALKNRKKEDIKNIAITGPYGSGKSSILKTFEENYKGSDLKFLNISLASFKDEKTKLDKDGNPIVKDPAELLRLIEISILQQIFYHEEDKKIPDSRFKKIRSYSIEKLWLYSLGYFLFILAGLNYFYPKFITNLFPGYTFEIEQTKLIYYATIAICATGIFTMLFKSIRIISSVTFSKLKFQNAEIGLGENLQKSILNHHIDEILYFFTVRPFNVIVIEDLDRFEETEIFTKLREINLLLNSSEKTKRKAIVFIYAVRDEMFTDSDRTKFFDFIIPVIPIINSSNSSNILLKKKEEFGYTLTDAFIEDIGFYLDDMRLLHNVTNEFYLYKEKLDKGLDQDKLFAMIVYKNVHPNDFVDLSYNKGEMFRLLNTKQDFTKAQISEIEQEIATLKKEISELNSVFKITREELRLIYISKTIEELTYFNGFLVNGAEVSFDEMVQENNFEYIISGKATYYKGAPDYNRIINRNTALPVAFSKIEKAVDPTRTYAKRLAEVNDLDSNKEILNRDKINELEKEKSALRGRSLSALVQSDNLGTLKIGDQLNKAMTDLLLRRGYIAEDYADYISLFHEGSLTQSDHQFKISVRNKQSLEFDYKLFKISKLVEKISAQDFSTPFVLNYYLVDHLLFSPNQYKSQIAKLFEKLSDESEASIGFIRGFIVNGINISQFILQISNHWPSILNFFAANNILDEVEKDRLLTLIIEHSSAKSLVAVSQKFNLAHILEETIILFEIGLSSKRIKEVIVQLNLRFQLVLDRLPDEIMSFIYEGNYYQINMLNVTTVIKKFGKFDQELFDTSNYMAIKNSEADILKNYVESEINTYIERIYLMISTNISEREKTYLSLLNHDKIISSNKSKLVEHVQSSITKLSDINDMDVSSDLLESSKVLPSWENMLTDFDNNEQAISESAIIFLNNIPNAELLAKIKIPDTKLDEKNVFSGLCRDLMENNKIDEKAFDLISQSSPWWYSDLQIENLGEKRVISLIEHYVIEPTKISFELVKMHYNGLNIKLMEKHKTKFLEILDDLTFDEKDIFFVLKSALLTVAEKIKIINATDQDTIVTNKEILVLLSQLLVNEPAAQIDKTLTDKIILSPLVNEINRITLFLRDTTYDTTLITEFLDKLGGEYQKINDHSKRAKLADVPIHQALVRRLANKGIISSAPEKKGMLTVYHKNK